MAVRVEFFGVARARAGVASIDVDAATLGEALLAAVARHPDLAGEVISGDRPADGYLVSLDGERFLNDPTLALAPGARLLLLSAHAGG
ncbi:MAG: MoaD/ThiS family protein [Planctomycetota bacterium]